jgi:hypothetical protein
MKLKKLNKCFLLFIIILISSHSAVIAQRTTPEKQDNLILIITDESAEENFISFGKFLVNEGFSFASKDKDFLIFTTNERTSHGGYKYTLTISFKDTLVSIRPRCNYVVFGSSIGNMQIEWIEWSYAKSKSSPFGIAFKAFEPILRKYNGQLYFTKE